MHPSSSETSECLSIKRTSAVKLCPMESPSELPRLSISLLSSEDSYDGNGSSVIRDSKVDMGLKRGLGPALFSFTGGSPEGAGWVDHSRKFIA